MESSFGRMEARINTPEYLLRVWGGLNFFEIERNSGCPSTWNQSRTIQRHFALRGNRFPPLQAPGVLSARWVHNPVAGFE